MNRGFYIRSRSVKSCTSRVTFLFLFPNSHRSRAWLALVQWHTYRSRMKLCFIEEIIQHGSFTSSSPSTHPSTMPFRYLHPMYEERRRNVTPAQTSTHVVRTELHATNPTYLSDNLEDPSTTYVPAFARRRTNPWRTHLDRTIAQARNVTVTDALRPASSQTSTIIRQWISSLPLEYPLFPPPRDYMHTSQMFSFSTPRFYLSPLPVQPPDLCYPHPHLRFPQP